MPACVGTLLVVALLSIESSYKENIERPRSSVPDTIQFWLAKGGVQWRIRTFAIDHDIHTHRIGSKEKPSDLEPEWVEGHFRKNYPDVIDRVETLCVPESKDSSVIAKLVADANLPGTLEISKAHGFAFLNPDAAKYSSQSTPK